MTTQKETLDELLANFDYTTAGPDPMRELLVKAWNAGAHYAVFHNWDDDSLGAYLNDPEAFLAYEEEEDDADTGVNAYLDSDEYRAYQEEMERQCGATYATSADDRRDPYATSCDLDRGHDGKHEGDSPFEGDNRRVRWNGGGTIAGDAVLNRNVEWVSAVVKMDFDDSHQA